MSQKIAIRQLDLPTHERYLGSDAYTEMFKTLELEAYAQKNCVSLPSGKKIDRE